MADRSRAGSAERRSRRKCRSDGCPDRDSLAFGQALYDRRTALGLSQTEVARRAAMSQRQISRIEAGDTVPTLPLLERLAEALESELAIHDE
ncbi:helix-turn-helix domain-containing protein [Kribbella sp. NBC_01245]|uniref:helix-turn-helix domain-containing protein n=1 Tax=Kribbella sp. NBC_01245 TaxID=2903578 RepID=UPI002E2D49EB|nr:helix-turn-helix transcriptional regulator [Kribbella sp. NBC_01245]